MILSRSKVPGRVQGFCLRFERKEAESSVIKRGGVYWFEFVYLGRRYRQSTHQTNWKVAKEMEAAYRTALAKGDFGFWKRTPAPPLKDFAQRSIDAIHVRCAAKPFTVHFYAKKLAWMPSRSCGLQAKAVLPFRSGTSIRHRRRWNGPSSG